MKKLFNEIAECHHVLYILHMRMALNHDNPEEIRKLQDKVSKVRGHIVELEAEMYL